MRVTLHDCEGPFWIRVVPLILLPLAFLLGSMTGSWLLGFSLFTLFATACGVMPRLQPRKVDLQLGGGELRIRRAGLRSQTLRTKDILGACTARVDGGTALTLARRDRKTPTTLVFETEAELERAREALAVGHGGFGEVGWPLSPGASDTWAPTFRATAALMALTAAVLAALELAYEEESFSVFGGILITFATFPAFVGIVGALARAATQRIELGPRGVSLRGFQYSLVPYSVISGIDVRNGTFELGVEGNALRAGHKVGALAGAGVDSAEMTILSSQLASCVGRARGLGPQKPEVITRVDTLKRGQEATRDWLARVDMAANLLTQSGYRGGTIEKEDLWLTLRDPEAAEDLRMAAGRMLVRVDTDPEVRTRVDDIVSAVREDTQRKRLRVAIFPELDPDGEELEALDRQEEKRRLQSP
jgi:hypothetical protein